MVVSLQEGPVPEKDANAVFFMHATNLATNKTTEQRMTFAQMKSSSNPFLQGALREYAKLKK